jgi:hypothetical protein
MPSAVGGLERESGDFLVSMLAGIEGVDGVGVDDLKGLRRPWALGAEATRRNCRLKTEVGDMGGEIGCFTSSVSETSIESRPRESAPSALDCPVLVPFCPLAPKYELRLPPPVPGVPFFSDGGVGSRGRCSVEEESAPMDFWEGAGEFVDEFETCVNLKRPFNFWPNWEADVERDRVPLTGDVGLLEREVEVVMVAVRALALHSLRVKAGRWVLRG